MKEKMKKLSVLTFYEDQEQITSMLQELGVVHLELDEKAGSQSIQKLQEDHSRISKIVQTLKDFQQKEHPVIPIAKTERLTVENVLEAVKTLKKNLDANVQHVERLTKDHSKLKPWGNFDREKLDLLEQNDVRFTFYYAGQKEFQSYDFQDDVCEVIHSDKGGVYFVHVEAGFYEPLPFEKVELPQNTLADIDSELARLAGENIEIAEKIRSLGSYVDELNIELEKTSSQLDYELAINSYHDFADGKILHLTGWYPEGIEKKIHKSLSEPDIFFTLSDPAPNDKVPVKLRNTGYARLFEPITRIFQLPNYYELDLTPLIAVFYPIFFAYCLGDAGYGLIVLAASWVGWFSFFKNARNLALLGGLLGALTTLMGVVKSGSVFGLPLTGSDDIAFFRFLSQFVFIPDDQNFTFNAFNVALMIGVVQIFTGVISSIVNKAIYHSIPAALPQAGKLLIITGTLVLFLANMQNVAVFLPYTSIAQIVLIGGIVLVLLSHDLGAGLFRRVGSGLLPLFFIFTGLLGDVLSYVRLFALGVASSVLGLVVNQIGMQIMGSGWWGVILGIVFLLFGHSLNLALAILGAFVHPLRLTFVEFYNNAQFEGGGIEYRPFKKLNRKTE